MNGYRKEFDYDAHAKKSYEIKKTILLNEIELLEHENNICLHQNQIATAYEILSKIKNRAILNIMVLGKTQSGKTGCMSALIKYYLHDNQVIMPLNNIFIITGLSSREWKNQTIARMPKIIQDRVYHRNDLLDRFYKDIKDKQNVLLLIDEIHIASKYDQTVCSTFKKIGLLDKDYLYNNDIKIVEFSATPDLTLYDLLKWGDASAMILSLPGIHYTSSYALLQQNRVKQYKDLSSGTEAYDELRDSINSFETYRYHIIRTKNAKFHDKTVSLFEDYFNAIGEYEYITYDGISEIDDINEILNIKPECHTFIFIKELIRCSKTLVKTFLGVLYERYTGYHDATTIIQSLIGRATGYDDNGDSIVYTNIETIKRYEVLWESGFKHNELKWNNKAIMNGGFKTINDPRLYDKELNKCNANKYKIELTVFKTFDEAKMYFDKYVKPTIGKLIRGFRPRASNKDGFYEHKIDGTYKVLSNTDIDKYKKYLGAGSNICNRFRLIPCYKDVKDATSIEWRLYYCVCI